MLNLDLNEKLEILEGDSAIKALKKKVQKGWISEEEFAKRVERIYSVKMRSLGLDPDSEPPVFSLPHELGDPGSDILVGYPLHDSRTMPGLYLPQSDFTQCHVGFWGKTRFGKTFSMAGILKGVAEKDPDRTFILYDTQNELVKILPNLIPSGRLLCISARDYWKNPLQGYRTHGPDRVIGALKRALLESVYIGDATVNLLERIIRSALTAERLAAFGPLTLKDMLALAEKMEERFASSRKPSFKRLQYIHSLINILANLSANLNDIYNRDIPGGFSFADFAGRVVVIDMSRVRDPIAVKFFITKELLDLFLYVTEKPAPPVTVVLDEAHRFAPVIKSGGNFTNPIIVELVKVSLKYGLNFWFAEQNPGQFMHPAILANVGTHLAFQLPNIKDRWPVLYSIGVTESQRVELLGCLNKRECVVYSESLKKAVLIQTPGIDIRDMRREAQESSGPVIEAFHKRFMAEKRGKENINKSPRSSQEKEKQKPAQDFTKLSIARHRAENPLAGITETYQRVMVSPEIGRKQVTEMLQLGWLEGPGNMPSPGKGNKTKKCYAVTEKGCEALGLDWSEVRLPGRGSLQSRLAAKMIGEFLKKRGRVFRYEYTLSSKTVSKAADVAELTENGVIAYEFENTDRHMVENIRRNKDAGFLKTIVVVPSTKAIKRAEKLIQNLGEGFSGFIEIRLLKEFAE